MRDNLSPEEKLLRLIKGQKEQDKTAQRAPAPAIAPASVPELKPSPKAAPHPAISIHLAGPDINKIIMVIFAITCIYLVGAFIYPMFGSREIILPQARQEKAPELTTGPEQEAKPYEFYQQGIRNRQIFSIGAAAESEKSIAAVSADLMKDLSLTGIIAGDNPQAIIEDKKAQKSYYLNKGQSFGEFQVEDIKEGKVILNYKGQKFELYL